MRTIPNFCPLKLCPGIHTLEARKPRDCNWSKPHEAIYFTRAVVVLMLHQQLTNAWILDIRAEECSDLRHSASSLWIFI